MEDWFSDAQATFGDRLAAAREAAGLTQEDLARRLGVREKTILAWEDDHSEPRANRLQMLAGLLNVSLVWLLTGEGDGIAPPDQTAAPASEDVEAALGDLRLLRSEMSRLADRIALTEKRLRRAVRSVPA